MHNQRLAVEQRSGACTTGSEVKRNMHGTHATHTRTSCTVKHSAPTSSAPDTATAYTCRRQCRNGLCRAARSRQVARGEAERPWQRPAHLAESHRQGLRWVASLHSLQHLPHACRCCGGLFG